MSNDFEAMIDEDFSLGNKNENHVLTHSNQSTLSALWPTPGAHLRTVALCNLLRFVAEQEQAPVLHGSGRFLSAA